MGEGGSGDAAENGTSRRFSPPLCTRCCIAFSNSFWGSTSRASISRLDKPDIVVNFLDADRLAREDGAEASLFTAQTDAAAMSDRKDLVQCRSIN